ncbi:unnamed protein product [Leptosia nina]|uniref:Uncharacterized protein n=1 Tax=Leptosia nina TaxID=320188 RepID=A0AAV1J9V8_9NEOP
MDFLSPASGDGNSRSPLPIPKNENLPVTHESLLENDILKDDKSDTKSTDDTNENEGNENENNLKERIQQCRSIIESLKLELTEEKARLERETKTSQHHPKNIEPTVTSDSISSVDDPYPPNFYSSCVESKLTCDENLIQYEKQLERYQNTLNMAQIEKKNAIRKQMIAKAYKLKLLEVENQCNIELLRVKQSLQCLEPLQMIANKWKTSTDEYAYDLDNFELMPRYPELHAMSGSDVSSVDSDSKNKSAITPD